IRADVSSLGCTFYFALTATKPVQGANALEIVLQHFQKEPQPLESLRPEIPLSMARIIRRLMDKSAAKRFQTPDELLAEVAFLGRDGGRPASVALNPALCPEYAGPSAGVSPIFSLGPIQFPPSPAAQAAQERE